MTDNRQTLDACQTCNGSGVVPEAHDGGIYPVHCPEGCEERQWVPRFMRRQQTPDTEALDALAALIEQSDFAEESAEIVIAAGWVSPEMHGELRAALVELRTVDDAKRDYERGWDDARDEFKPRVEKAEAEVAQWREFHVMAIAEAADEVARLIRVLEGVRALANDDRPHWEEGDDGTYFMEREPCVDAADLRAVLDADNEEGDGRD